MDTTIISTTKSTNTACETGKTDKTADVTNNDFLEAIFGTEYSDTRP